MTLDEILLRTQGKRAGIVNRASLRYAETMLLPEEVPAAAVIANLIVGAERFPGAVVLTDRRILAACGLPGIKRYVSCGPRWFCLEDPSVLRHKFMFSDGKCAFSMMVDPDTGARFSRYVARALGEENAVFSENSGGILNPALRGSKQRARQVNAKRLEEVARHLEKTDETADKGARPASSIRQE